MALAGAVLCGARSVAAQPCVPPPPDLVGWWPGDGNARDLAQGRTGTLNNGARFAPGEVRLAFGFPAADSDATAPFVNVGTSTDLAPTPFTADFWMNAAAINDIFNHPVGRWGGTDAQDSWLFDYHNDSKVHFYIMRTGQGAFDEVVSPTPIALNEWHHIAATYDGTTIELYQDGLLAAQLAVSGTIQSDPTSMTSFGCKLVDGTCNYRFTGSVDEVELFNRVLAPEEIAAIFSAGAAGKCKPTESLPVLSPFNRSGQLGLVALIGTLLLWSLRRGLARK